MAFNKLSKEELLRTLEEDFAFALNDEEKKTKNTILAAIAEGQLKFGDYLAANPDKRAQFEPEVVTANVPPVVAEVQPLPGVVTANGVVVQEEVPVVSAAPWLIKMTRENPHYEVGPYTFTKTHPYVLVRADDAETVLREEGFRQAYPSELQDFYS